MFAKIKEKALTTILIKQNISQKDLAKKMNCSRSYINQIILKKNNLSSKSIKKILDSLNKLLYERQVENTLKNICILSITEKQFTKIQKKLKFEIDQNTVYFNDIFQIKN